MKVQNRSIISLVHSTLYSFADRHHVVADPDPTFPFGINLDWDSDPDTKQGQGRN
jgi:hypothetical protein